MMSPDLKALIATLVTITVGLIVYLWGRRDGHKAGAAAVMDDAMQRALPAAVEHVRRFPTQTVQHVLGDGR